MAWRIEMTSIEKFKLEFAELLRQTIISDDLPSENKQETYRRLRSLLVPNIPQSLFRYRKVVRNNEGKDYSIEGSETMKSG